GGAGSLRHARGQRLVGGGKLFDSFLRRGAIRLGVFQLCPQRGELLAGGSGGLGRFGFRLGCRLHRGLRRGGLLLGGGQLAFGVGELALEDIGLVAGIGHGGARGGIRGGRGLRLGVARTAGGRLGGGDAGRESLVRRGEFLDLVGCLTLGGGESRTLG